MPATVADPNRSLDSEQISPATIAHHTVYENTPNLHQSHICQWGAQPYLVGPLSRLVGKLPLSPWVSADFLPLTQVVNNTNSAIPLTEIFDRVFSDVCNSLGFEVQKQKKRGSGNNRVYRNLKLAIKQNPSIHTINKSYPYKTHACTTNIMVPFLSLTHAVTNIRYSVNHKHHERYW